MKSVYIMGLYYMPEGLITNGNLCVDNPFRMRIEMNTAIFKGAHSDFVPSRFDIPVKDRLKWCLSSMQGRSSASSHVCILIQFNSHLPVWLSLFLCLLLRTKPATL